MTKRARRSVAGARAAPVVGVLLLAALAAAAWYALGRRAPAPAADATHAPVEPSAPLAASAERVAAENEGRTLRVAGALRAARPPKDTELGVAADADAIALLRTVELLQWREDCGGGACRYALAWSERPIDSTKFREPAGHENAARLPFASARFVAADVRLGAFRVDAALVARLVDASEAVAYPVHVADLPANLAATFRERDGALYAGAGAAEPQAGDLRVRYRIVAGGERSVVGVQAGDRLLAPPR
ncbi:MAG TPA: TMEM43 family protein [Dokdonella sp.]